MKVIKRDGRALDYDRSKIKIAREKANGDGQEYDYLGVLYPEGHIGEEFQYLFNHEDISKIVFRGFDDEERQKFLENLSGIYNQQ